VRVVRSNELSQPEPSYNNTKLVDFVDRIYPIQFEIKDTIDTARYASCLSIHHENDSEGSLKHYDISDDFNFDFVSFTFIHSCIPGTY
jgi:hypothetical protein